MDKRQSNYQALDQFMHALSLLSASLEHFPDKSALLGAIGTVDVSDEVWLALNVIALGEEERHTLRNFLLMNPSVSAIQVNQKTLALVGSIA